MSLNWRSILSLKAWVLVTFLVLWNLGFFVSMQAGGGGLTGGLAPAGMKISGYVCLAACAFSLSVATSKSIQSFLIAPSRAANFSTREFYFIAFITGFLAISRFVFPALEVSANAS